MNHRTFNSVMHFANEKWAAEVLNMNVNPEKGPDLVDGKKVVECKFTLVHPGRYTHLCWRVLGYQADYDNEAGKEGKKAYWAFGTYALDRPLSSVQTKNLEKLEHMVQERTLMIARWDWIKQFPAYHESGKTELSEWDHEIIFPKGRLLPETTRQYNVSKGNVYLTEGVNPGDFLINPHP